MRPALLVATLVALLTAVFAAPARAHDGEGQAASNYASRVERGPAGLDVRVVVGSVLALRNDTGQEVTVAGYEGEPFLRVGPAGVFINTASGVSASLPPRWERVASEPAWSWHDDRIHWPAATAPPQVKVDPSRTVRVLDWQVPLTIDGEEATIDGSVTWVPAPPWPPWMLAGVLAMAALLVAVARRGDLARGAATGLAVAATFALIRGVDLLALPRASAVPALPNGWPALAALVALAAAVWTWRRPAAWPLVAAGGLILVLTTAGDAVSVLGSSQIPTRLPDPLARLCAALSLAAAIPTLTGLGLIAATPREHDGDERATRKETGDREEQAAALAGRRLRGSR